VIIERKAPTRLGKFEKAQIANCLNVTGYEIGLMLNSGVLSFPNLTNLRNLRM